MGILSLKILKDWPLIIIFKIFEDPRKNFQEPSRSWRFFNKIFEDLDKDPLESVLPGLIQPLLDFQINHYFYVNHQFKRKCHATVDISITFIFSHFKIK